MKVFLILFLHLRKVFSFNHFCGYYGVMGTDIEQKLDDCFDKHVKDSRLMMSIGFELCLGFNYAKLNSTVAAPIEQFQGDANKELI